MKSAYLWFNAGICYVLTYPGQQRICCSKHWRRATRRARNLGYDVTIYTSWYCRPPKDAVRVTRGGYVLPAKERRK